jgi:hypothetical protein
MPDFLRPDECDESRILEFVHGTLSFSFPFCFALFVDGFARVSVFGGSGASCNWRDFDAAI